MSSSCCGGRGVLKRDLERDCDLDLDLCFCLDVERERERPAALTGLLDLDLILSIA